MEVPAAWQRVRDCSATSWTTTPANVPSTADLAATSGAAADNGVRTTATTATAVIIIKHTIPCIAHEPRTAATRAVPWCDGVN